ncbi:oxygenase MpaB family protein [Streptacidiphilus sp. EB129]|uniref:oxygenase MpaB family protein n=1 Tax=Streptacidiphilus sp. EB129 TaxID=3156262 RepID=UPI0035152EA7
MEDPTSPTDTLRGEGDPLADRVVAELLDTGEIAHANQVLHGLRRNDQSVAEDLPQVLRDYLTATNPVPAWVDPERITRVHQFFRHDGVHVASALSLGGMVASYASPLGAKLLHTTHRLDHPHRRLSETTQFLLHMMAKDPLGPHGQLIPAIQKVRLIHAAVRQLLLRGGHWDVARHGVPICQEDLLGATLIFSVTVLDGMERLGVRCTAQEAEDYYYTWRVVGVMLGLRPEAIPETLDQARQTWARMAPQHLGPSPEGIALTGSLLDFYHQITPPGAHGAIPALARAMVGPRTADWMQVPPSRWDKTLAKAARWEERANRAEDHHALARTVLDHVGQIMLNREVRRVTHGQSTEFDIPQDLDTTTDIPTPRDNTSRTAPTP